MPTIFLIINYQRLQIRLAWKDVLEVKSAFCFAQVVEFHSQLKGLLTTPCNSSNSYIHADIHILKSLLNIYFISCVWASCFIYMCICATEEGAGSSGTKVADDPEPSCSEPGFSASTAGAFNHWALYKIFLLLLPQPSSELWIVNHKLNFLTHLPCSLSPLGLAKLP